MPRPKSHTLTDVTTAALTVLDQDGYAALSMRAVARELGVSPMALYRYVADRDELERLVADRILEPLVQEVDAGPWQHRIAVLADRLRAAAGAHPEAVPLLLRHRHDTLNSVRWIETMLAVLAEAGFHSAGRVLAQRAIVHHVLGAIQAQQLSPLDGAGTASLAELPPAEFPHLAATASIARGMDPDDEFHRGLASLLEGLRREAGSPTTPPPA
ncbi:TetR/AcrR family transcriptional regulator [Brachybacterium fresconis]|uniref:AcrR family transcriptional regulator n=1 Tax=Brachybacterium fresconis TaxID=173363 RepID=A0ABS4YJT1_9MICO|nr:TetR/AcrR family transcriptional regulator [Brachybacterium fresconis]MBP2409059.1 AcrR family transcriptional regulator [Brachybacterium fresconis]